MVQIGEYLGEPGDFNIKVMHAYVDQLDMKGMARQHKLLRDLDFILSSQNMRNSNFWPLSIKIPLLTAFALTGLLRC
jgi:hypothetical protein